MDDFQNDNVDLLNFINKKTQEKCDNEPKKIFFLFTKSIRLSLISTFEQQQQISYAISCTDLIINIFWIIYNYSHNAKLTMFMCERAVLLFNEYINISKNYGNDNTNLIDVKQFIINKTIGPLKLPSKLVNSSIRNITELSQIYTKFIYKIFSKIVRVHNHYYTPTIFLESISCILSNIIYKIYNLNMVSYIEKELLLLSDYDILDLPREVNLLKIKLELLLNCTEFIDNPLLSQKIANRIITEEIDVIDDLHDINEFFDCENKIQDRDFFKELIIKLKEYTHKKTVKH
tara:strand:+ start:4923 stop:5789 length:867 start_codon:yes stop_codon:yes gene_type:complete